MIWKVSSSSAAMEGGGTLGGGTAGGGALAAGSFGGSAAADEGCGWAVREGFSGGAATAPDEAALRRREEELFERGVRIEFCFLSTWRCGREGSGCEGRGVNKVV